MLVSLKVWLNLIIAKLLKGNELLRRGKGPKNNWGFWANSLSNRINWIWKIAQTKLCINQDYQRKQNKKAAKRVRDRYDSVYRSLLRRFRKFYNINFDKATRYKALKRYRKPVFFMEWISTYITTIFVNNSEEQLLFDLANLIYPSLLVKHSEEFSEKYPHLKDFLRTQEEKKIQISDILFNFTFTKMELLLSQPGYSLLFHYFVK